MNSNSTINVCDAEDDASILNGATKVEEGLPSKDECSRSIDAFCVSQNGEVSVLTVGGETEVSVTSDKKLQSHFKPSQVKTLVPSQFRVLSWNIDGLDSVNRNERTKACMKIIEREKPDIVFLQEVIVTVLNYMEENMPLYQIIAAGSESYFCVMMLRRRTVNFDGQKLIEFKGTSMGRNLLMVDAHIGDCKLRLMTSHLESMREGAKERMKQFKEVLEQITNAPSEFNCIFGGDTNLRDHEVVSVGGLPDDVSDIWEATGERPETKYTWDLTRNTNKSFPSNPRLRFDRMYMRTAANSSSAKKRAEAKLFRLVGTRKVELTQSFPSDHWGCLVHFDVVNCT